MPEPSQPLRSARLRYARGLLDLAQTRVMAIVNMTPDSFSDGGRFVVEGATPAISVAVRQCARWLAAGASILDIGGESTRPGAEPVPHDTEIARVVPVIEALRADPETADAVLSVDTRHAAVAEAGLSAGADIINDVSGLADPAMADTVARFDAGLVIGHMRGTPKTMQRSIHFDDLFREVGEELVEALERAYAAGVGHDQVLVDPCVGFGKTAEQSAALVAGGTRLMRRSGVPVLIGASRKSFLAQLSGRPAAERELASVVAAVTASRHGAAVVRVHDVEATLEGLAVFRGVEAAYAAFGGDDGPVGASPGDEGRGAGRRPVGGQSERPDGTGGEP